MVGQPMRYDTMSTAESSILWRVSLREGCLVAGWGKMVCRALGEGSHIVWEVSNFVWEVSNFESVQCGEF